MVLFGATLAATGSAGAAPTTELLPPSASWLAFCAAVDAASPACDPIPASDAMPDGAPVSSPQGWRDYCARNRVDSACGG